MNSTINGIIYLTTNYAMYTFGNWQNSSLHKHLNINLELNELLYLNKIRKDTAQHTYVHNLHEQTCYLPLRAPAPTHSAHGTDTVLANPPRDRPNAATYKGGSPDSTANGWPPAGGREASRNANYFRFRQHSLIPSWSTSLHWPHLPPPP